LFSARIYPDAPPASDVPGPGTRNPARACALAQLWAAGRRQGAPQQFTFYIKTRSGWPPAVGASWQGRRRTRPAENREEAMVSRGVFIIGAQHKHRRGNSGHVPLLKHRGDRSPVAACGRHVAGGGRSVSKPSPPLIPYLRWRDWRDRPAEVPGGSSRRWTGGTIPHSGAPGGATARRFARSACRPAAIWGLGSGSVVNSVDPSARYIGGEIQRAAWDLRKRTACALGGWAGSARSLDARRPAGTADFRHSCRRNSIPACAGAAALIRPASSFAKRCWFWWHDGDFSRLWRLGHRGGAGLGGACALDAGGRAGQPRRRALP